MFLNLIMNHWRVIWSLDPYCRARSFMWNLVYYNRISCKQLAKMLDFLRNDAFKMQDRDVSFIVLPLLWLGKMFLVFSKRVAHEKWSLGLQQYIEASENRGIYSHDTLHTKCQILRETVSFVFLRVLMFPELKRILQQKNTLKQSKSKKWTRDLNTNLILKTTD